MSQVKMRINDKEFIISNDEGLVNMNINGSTLYLSSHVIVELFERMKVKIDKTPSDGPMKSIDIFKSINL